MNASRREFMRVAAALGAALALPACPPEEDPSPPSPDAGVDESALPSLGGAPDTHEGRTIAAFCDTVVPGKHRDPTGAPGALDSGAPAMFFDPELPALAYVGLLVVALDAYARQEAGARFVELVPAARERALDRAVAALDLLGFAIQLAKLAHFSSDEAARHLGYPGANAGYVADPDFSFNRPMSQEITGDGNLP